MTDNVVPLFSNNPKRKRYREVVPASIETPIQAIVDWADANGIDIQNNVAFHIRLADFMSLLQTELNSQECHAVKV